VHCNVPGHPADLTTRRLFVRTCTPVAPVSPVSPTGPLMPFTPRAPVKPRGPAYTYYIGSAR